MALTEIEQDLAILVIISHHVATVPLRCRRTGALMKHCGYRCIIEVTLLNVYGYSKYLFDQYIRRQQDKLTTQVVGLRYFNVYGPRESHKDSMASVAYHLNNQLLDGGSIRLFEGCDGYSNGEQRRDFIYINDVVAVNLWFLDNPDKSGIFNVGTGRSQTFNEVAQAVINFHGRGALTYVPFPEHLVGCYQSFTEANLENLRASGCGHQFMSVEDGVSDYLTWLNPK